MIKLTNWCITEYNSEQKGIYIAHGTVFGHPRLADGIYIHTSKIEKLEMNKSSNSVIMHTKSGNEYELLLKELSLKEFEMTKEIMEEFKVSLPDYKKCEKMIREEEENTLANVAEQIQDGELYLKIAGPYVQKAFWKTEGKEIRAIQVTSHIGMFQDSYLVTDWEKGEVDFRYFDGYFSMEPYHISDGLSALLIENSGSTDITYICDGQKDEKKDITCKAGEVTRIDCLNFKNEGLFSPDVVNGKGIYKDVF